MQKKNVLLVIRWPVGGIRTFVRYVYRNFDADCWQFTIIAPAVGEIEAMKTDFEGLSMRFVLTVDKPSTATFAFTIARELFGNRYSLVHSHGYISGICTALFAKLSQTPHIVTLHDVIQPEQFRGCAGWLKKQIIENLFALPECFHSVSQDAQDNLFSFFPSIERGSQRCVVIQNGVEVERFVYAEPRDLRGELSLEEEYFLIGFFGRFMSPKGFRYLIEAMALLREQDLPRKPIVLAFGWGGFIREEQQAIREKRLDKYFIFMPFADNVAGAIKGVDLVVMPSVWEACPLLPMEALLCGTPIIVTDCKGLREVVRGTPAIQVKSKDSIGLKDAIAQAVVGNYRKVFGDYAKCAEKDFDIKSRVSSFLKLYESCSK